MVKYDALSFASLTHAREPTLSAIDLVIIQNSYRKLVAERIFNESQAEDLVKHLTFELVGKASCDREFNRRIITGHSRVVPDLSTPSELNCVSGGPRLNVRMCREKI